jgi:prepilin-type processing-associated H-X9-DG protein
MELKLTKKDIVILSVCAVFLLMSIGAIGGAGRGRAKEMVCLINAKHLAHAWLMYKDDNDGKLVGGYVINQPHAWVQSPGINATIEQRIEAIRKGALFPYIGDIYVYRCPADIRQKDPIYFGFRSFSIAGGANGENWAGYVQAKNYSDIKDPAGKYIFLEEIDPRGNYFGTWLMNFNPPEWVDPLAMWHNEQSSFGFADGHSELHKWNDQSLIEWCERAMLSPLSFRFYMTPPADEQEDITFMANGYPCKEHD